MAELKVVKPGTQTPLARLVDAYLLHCQAKGLSPATYKNAYAYPLRKVLVPFCGEEGIKEVGEITSRVLDRLAVRLEEVGGLRGALSPATRHAYLRATNHFLAWAKQEGEPVDAKAKLWRLERRRLVPLRRDEIRLMEDTAGEERDRLIVRVLADSGIRVGELVALRTTDLEVRGRSRWLVIRRGKGGRGRDVPLPPQLYERLHRYADRTRPRNSGSDRLFLSLYRNRVSLLHEPLTESGVQQMIRHLAAKAGVEREGGVHPHLFRHSFITWCAKRRIPQQLVAQWVGHSSLQMIMEVYTHVSHSDGYEVLLAALREGDDE